jgi:hypothetical protein
LCTQTSPHVDVEVFGNLVCFACPFPVLLWYNFGVALGNTGTIGQRETGADCFAAIRGAARGFAPPAEANDPLPGSVVDQTLADNSKQAVAAEYGMPANAASAGTHTLRRGRRKEGRKKRSGDATCTRRFRDGVSRRTGGGCAAHIFLISLCVSPPIHPLSLSSSTACSVDADGNPVDSQEVILTTSQSGATIATKPWAARNSCYPGIFGRYA